MMAPLRLSITSQLLPEPPPFILPPPHSLFIIIFFFKKNIFRLFVALLSSPGCARISPSPFHPNDDVDPVI